MSDFLRNLIRGGVCWVVVSTVLHFLFSSTAGAQGLTQGEWARMLVQSLGLEEKGIPKTEPRLEDYAALLSGRSLVRMDLMGGAGFLPYEEEAAEKRPHETTTYRFDLKQSGNYLLKVKLKGEMQFITVDNETTIPVEATPGAEWTATSNFILARGNHQLSIAVPGGGVTEAVEFNSFCSRRIEPNPSPEGGEAWRLDAPLTFADKAATMIQLMDLTNRLPIKESTILEERGGKPLAALIDPTSPQGALLLAQAGQSGGGGATAHYRLNLKHAAIYSIMLKVNESGTQFFTIDGCKTFPVSYSVGPGRTIWVEVATLNLQPGKHVIERRPGKGDILTAVLARRSSGPADYLKVMTDMGYQEGPPGERVTPGQAKTNLENPDFKERVKPPTGEPTALDLPVPPLPMEPLEGGSLSTFDTPVSPMAPAQE